MGRDMAQKQVGSVEVSYMMETYPFAMKEPIRVEEINMNMLENLIKEIVRKALLFNLIDYNKAVIIEDSAKMLAEQIIKTIKNKVKKMCHCPSRRMKRAYVLRETFDVTVGRITMKFVVICEAGECKLNLIEIK